MIVNSSYLLHNKVVMRKNHLNIYSGDIPPSYTSEELKS